MRGGGWVGGKSNTKYMVELHVYVHVVKLVQGDWRFGGICVCFFLGGGGGGGLTGKLTLSW